MGPFSAIFGVVLGVLEKEQVYLDENWTIMEGEMNDNEGVLTSNEAHLLRYFWLIGLGNVAFG